jgi:protein ImuA
MSGRMLASGPIGAPASVAQATLARLRETVTRAGVAAAHVPGAPGQLATGALHEMFAVSGADAAAACGFAALSALKASGGRAILWVRQTMMEAEFGLIHAPGLVQLGIDPARVTLVRVRDASEALKAADEAVHCTGLGAVIVDLHGNPAKLDLTATRRLALGAAQTGVTVCLTRNAAQPAPSAATTLWAVRTMPSRRLEARAPGPPAFALTLLRDKAGGMQREWQVEWNRDEARFEPCDTASRDAPRRAAPGDFASGGGARSALSQPVAAFPANGPDQAAGGSRRRMG